MYKKERTKHASRATCALKSSTRTGNRFSAKGSLATFPTRSDPERMGGAIVMAKGGIEMRMRRLCFYESLIARCISRAD